MFIFSGLEVFPTKLMSQIKQIPSLKEEDDDSQSEREEYFMNSYFSHKFY